MGGLRKLPRSIGKTPRFTPYRWISFKLGRIPRGRRLPEEDRQSVLDMSTEIDREKEDLVFRGASLYDAKIGDARSQNEALIKLQLRARTGMQDGEEVFERGQKTQHCLQEDQADATADLSSQSSKTFPPVSPSWGYPIEEPPPAESKDCPSATKDVLGGKSTDAAITGDSNSSTRYELASPGERSPDPLRTGRSEPGERSADSSGKGFPEPGDRSPKSDISSSLSSTRYMLASSARHVSDCSSGSDGSTPRKLPRRGTPSAQISSSSVTEERSTSPVLRKSPSTSTEHFRGDSPRFPDMVPPVSPDNVQKPQLPTQSGPEIEAEVHDARVPSLVKEQERGIEMEHLSPSPDLSSRASSESVHFSSPRDPRQKGESPTEGSRSPPVSQEIETGDRARFELSRSLSAAGSREELFSVTCGSIPPGSRKPSPPKSLEPYFPNSSESSPPKSLESSPPKFLESSPPKYPEPSPPVSGNSRSPASDERDPPQLPARKSSASSESPSSGCPGVITPCVPPNGSPVGLLSSALGALENEISAESPEILTRVRDYEKTSAMVSSAFSRDCTHPEEEHSEHETAGISQDTSLKDSGSDSEFSEAHASEFVSPEITTHGRNDRSQGYGMRVSPNSSEIGSSDSNDSESVSPEIVTHGQINRDEESSSHVALSSSQDCHSGALSAEFRSPEIITRSEDQRQQASTRVSHASPKRTPSRPPESGPNVEERDSIEPIETTSAGTPDDGISETVPELPRGSPAPGSASNVLMASREASSLYSGDHYVESPILRDERSAGFKSPEHSTELSATSSSDDEWSALFKLHELPPEEAGKLDERVFGDDGTRNQSGEEGISSSDSSQSPKTSKPRGAEDKSSALVSLVSGDITSDVEDLSSFWLELARKETMDP